MALTSIFHSVDSKTKLYMQAYTIRGESMTDLLDLSNQKCVMCDNPDLNCVTVDELTNASVKKLSDIDAIFSTVCI